MRVRRGLVLGCGGTVGGAWTVGALSIVASELGWDPREADLLVGTSAGSSLVTLLGGGTGVDELVAGQRDETSARPLLRSFFTQPPSRFPSLPAMRLTAPRMTMRGLGRLPTLAGLVPVGRATPTFLDDIAAEFATVDGWVAHPSTWLVAVDLDSGGRVAFGSPDAPRATLRQALHASWAMPAFYKPVELDGRRYADGGIASTASVDLTAAAGLDEVVLIAPMASRGNERVGGIGGIVEGVMRGPMSSVLDREVAALEAAGTRVVRIHPSRADLAVMGPNFMDPRRRLASLETALESVPLQLV